ncbi:unnamed protein product, partial [Prorocentrum cordatum]
DQAGVDIDEWRGDLVSSIVAADFIKYGNKPRQSKLNADEIKRCSSLIKKLVDLSPNLSIHEKSTTQVMLAIAKANQFEFKSRREKADWAEEDALRPNTIARHVQQYRVRTVKAPSWFK